MVSQFSAVIGEDVLPISPPSLLTKLTSDIAYKNGMRDNKDLPTSLPAFVANLPDGHVGTYFSNNGGKFGIAAVKFFKWTLKDDAEP